MKQTLSPREKQILKMIMAEYSLYEICKSLNLSYSRVSTVKSIIMEKWEVENTVGLVKESIRRGYLELEEDTFENESITNHELNSKEVVYEYKESPKHKFIFYLK